MVLVILANGTLHWYWNYWQYWLINTGTGAGNTGWVIMVLVILANGTLVLAR